MNVCIHIDGVCGLKNFTNIAKLEGKKTGEDFSHLRIVF